jgi:shikimate dehydrogenase
MLTLLELRHWQHHGVGLGVVGYPIRHSLSPLFQNAALKSLATTKAQYNDWTYHRIEAPVDDLEEVLNCCRDAGFKGLNLTLPHKVEALQFVDHVDPVAARTGAVNTLSFKHDGIHACNTDGHGLIKGMESTLGMSPKGAKILLIGAGGAARAAAATCIEAGCRCLHLLNRSPERLEALRSDLVRNYPHACISTSLMDQAPLESALGAIAIHATSLGLKPEDPLPLPIEWIRSCAGLYDMVYGKEPTQLVKAAKDAGIPASDGISMLLHQGAKAFEIWTGEAAPIPQMQEALEQALGRTGSKVMRPLQGKS